MNTEKTNYKGITLPEGFAPTKIEGEDSIDDGLVITDGYGNEYVWVEVPKTIYEDSTYNDNDVNKPTNSQEYTKIEACLKAYTSDYTEQNYSDTNPSFIVQYQNMLKSVYENSGFWIGRYEAGVGSDIPRISNTEITDKAVIKQNMIPYSYVTRDEAQKLATKMNYMNCTSSLLFGIQWDLTLKYIEAKNATSQEKLKSDGEMIGNYLNSEFILNRGKFEEYGFPAYWYNFDSEEKTNLVEKCKKKHKQNFQKEYY